jgi:predicted solute-binding protein
MKHDQKVIDAVNEIIQRFAELMEVDFSDIEEYHFLYNYHLSDMFFSYHEISLSVKYNLNFNQFSDWYWNYRIVGSAKQINLQNYIKSLK